MSSVKRNLTYRQESEGERRFREQWERLVPDLVLEQEYVCGPYRLDFAHLPSKSAIEIDGLRGHATPADIEKDRQRQRALEDLGWRFRRFGGREAMYATAFCVRDAAAFIRRVQAPSHQADPSSQPQHSPAHAFFGSQAASAGSGAPISAHKRRPSQEQESVSAPPAGITTPARRLSRRRLLLGVLALTSCCFCESALLSSGMEPEQAGSPILSSVKAAASLPPGVHSGQVLYQADWRSGLALWQRRGDWRLRSGVLLSAPSPSVLGLALIWAPIVLILAQDLGYTCLHSTVAEKQAL